MNPFPRNKFIFILITALIALMGGYLIFYATPWGLWAFSDSSAYLSAARNIQAGNGAAILNSNGSFTPVTEFPPLFPFILSRATPINGDFLLTNRWLNIILFAVSIFTIGLISFRVFNKLIPSLFSSMLLAVSPLMVDTFSGFMSEPLFITLLLLLVLFFIEFINSKKSLFLLPIFIISPLLPMVRYAGIFFVVGISFCLILYRKKYAQKINHILPSYVLFSLAPIGLWFINQYQNLNKVGGKRFVVDLAYIKNGFQSILQEINIIKGWFPYSGIYSSKFINQTITLIFFSLFIFAIVFGLTTTFKKGSNKDKKALILFQTSLIFLCLYFLFIAFTHNLTIPRIDIIDRMMTPIFPFLVLIILCSIELLSREGKGRFMRYGLLLIALISIRFYGMSTLNSVESLHTEGKGFTSRQYQQSKLINTLKSLPDEQSMISNSAAFVLFYTNRFPLQVDQFHNRSYGSGNAYGEKSFRENDAALILLFPEFHNFYGEKSYQLLNSLTAGLQVDFRDEIGGIYYYPD